MSGFFQALVVGGAAISAAACGGQSAHAVDDPGGAGTSGLTGAGATGGVGATGGAGAQGGAGSGGVSASGMGGLGAQAGVGVIELGGQGGAGGVGPLPDLDATAQWNCTGVATGACVDVLGTTALKLESDCAVDPLRPRSAADCGETQRFSCYLAVTAAGDLTLVNCVCQDGLDCGICTNPVGRGYGPPAECAGGREVCACAYTGILIAK